MQKLILKVIIAFSIVLITGCGGSKFIWDSGDEEKTDGSGGASESPPPLGSAKISNSRLTNLNDITTALAMNKLHDKQHFGQGIKVAIFDNGYTDLGFSLGTRLPPNLVVQPYPKNKPAETIHGTKMAEIAYAVATGDSQYSAQRPGPELLLYNTNGLTNFKHAINDAIKNDVDMILYAQIWEYGGNRDGHGFINQYVNRATNAGIVWVNAAGNYGRSTYSGPVSITENSMIGLPYENNKVRLVVDEKYPVKITLAWNDFQDDIRYATQQDLDLIVKDQQQNIIATSALKQDGIFHEEATKGVTAHAREIIKKELSPGTYYLEVKANSRNFRPTSQLWITANGAKIPEEDAGTGDSILIPADNSHVFAVGAHDVDYSASRGDGSKPDFFSPSLVQFSDGQAFGGTSAASAISVGALASFASSRAEKLSPQVLRRLLKQQLTTTDSENKNNRGSEPFNILNFSRL